MDVDGSLVDGSDVDGSLVDTDSETEMDVDVDGSLVEMDVDSETHGKEQRSVMYKSPLGKSWVTNNSSSSGQPISSQSSDPPKFSGTMASGHGL